MLRIFLSVVSIFVANAAFASDRFDQYDNNTSYVLCYADSEVVCSQDIDDVELVFSPSSCQVNSIKFVGNSPGLHAEFIAKLYPAFFTIRAPPHYYLYS